MHARAAPIEATARAVFDAVEFARVEALGSRGYAGIADNLSSALDVRLRSDPITRAFAALTDADADRVQRALDAYTPAALAA